MEVESPPLSTYQWFIIRAGFSFLLVWWSYTPPSLPLSHMHTQLLTADRSIWHPQGQQSFILGPRHNRACSAYPPPPPPHPPPFLLPLPAEKQLLPPALEVFWRELLTHKTFAKEAKTEWVEPQTEEAGKNAIYDSVFRLQYRTSILLEHWPKYVGMHHCCISIWPDSQSYTLIKYVLI